MVATISTTEEVQSLVRDYRKFALQHPIDYCKRILGITPHAEQRAILEAAADPNVKYISWRSGNGVGKTYLTAAMIAHYLDTHCPGYVVVTGASWTGILKTIWPTLRKVLRDAPVNLGGKVLSTEWRRGDMWGAFCVSPDEPENFGGFRTKNGALVIVDEASSLNQNAMEAIRGVCSASGSKVILLGNPLRPEGPFFDTFSSAGWANFHTSSVDVARLGIAGLATLEWCQDMAEEYGEDSPVYQARVLGNFPQSTFDSLVKLEWLSKIIIPKRTRYMGDRRMGVDVARFGDDRTVFVMRDDRCVLECETHTKLSTMQTVGLTQEYAEKWKVRPENIFIDDTGLGGGVTDRLHELGISVTPINFGERAFDYERFANVRAELYWNMRSHLRPDAEEGRVFIPKEFAQVVKECTWPKYKILSDRRIQLEPKADIKKRKKRSPDLADAFALTFVDHSANFSIGAA